MEIIIFLIIFLTLCTVSFFNSNDTEVTRNKTHKEYDDLVKKLCSDKSLLSEEELVKVKSEHKVRLSTLYGEYVGDTDRINFINYLLETGTDIKDIETIVHERDKVHTYRVSVGSFGQGSYNEYVK